MEFIAQFLENFTNSHIAEFNNMIPYTLNISQEDFVNPIQLSLGNARITDFINWIHANLKIKYNKNFVNSRC